MLPTDVIQGMRDAGALKAKRVDEEGNLFFDIDFRIVQEQFPAHLHFLVRQQLNDLEGALYDNGYIAFEVLADGRLQWKPTRKTLELYKNTGV